MKRQDKDRTRQMMVFGLLFLCLEAAKQLYLWQVYFGGSYDVWYLPFQLCSMPLYLCLLYPLLKTPAATFLQDFGFLGGLMALLYHEGFTEQGRRFLAVHGFVWHVGMLALALWIGKRGLSDPSGKGFLRAVLLFLVLAAAAVGLNVIFHPWGNCDMFYLSPYHVSAQPVFREIDLAAGRPLGMLIYLFFVVLGAGIVHILMGKVFKNPQGSSSGH